MNVHLISEKKLELKYLLKKVVMNENLKLSTYISMYSKLNFPNNIHQILFKIQNLSEKGQLTIT